MIWNPFFFTRFSSVFFTVDVSLLLVLMKTGWLCSLFQCLQAVILSIRLKYLLLLKGFVLLYTLEKTTH